MAHTTVSPENRQTPQVIRRRSPGWSPEYKNEARAISDARRRRGIFTRALSDLKRAARTSKNDPRGNFTHYRNMLNLLDMAKKEGVWVGGVDRANRIEQKVLRERAEAKMRGLGKAKLYESLTTRTTPTSPAAGAPAAGAPPVSTEPEEPEVQHTAYVDPTEGEFYGEVDPLTPVFGHARALYQRSLLG